jgi:hypothetical protein
VLMFRFAAASKYSTSIIAGQGACASVNASWTI